MSIADDIYTRIRAKEFEVPGHYSEYDRIHYRFPLGQKKELFRAALERAYGLGDHPRAGDLFNIAWAEGHSMGYTEVAHLYDTMSVLLKEKVDE
jgi:hypothetical protein